MKSIDVLIAWELGGGLGHVGRLRPLAESLIRMGRRVAFAVRDLHHCPTIFEGTSIPCFQAPIRRSRTKDHIEEPRIFSEILYNVGFNDAEDLASRALAWKDLIETLRPRLVILEHSPTALLALQGMPCRTAVVGNGFFFPPDTSPQQDLRPWLSQNRSASERIDGMVVKNSNTALVSLGQKPDLTRITELYARADEAALVTFPELDHFSPRTGVRYWGTWDSSWGDSPPWPVGPDRKVFFYLKPTPILQPLLRAIPRLGISAVVYAPDVSVNEIQTWTNGAATVLNRPGNLKAICHASDLVVLHGTHGVACEALLAGKPLVNFPITLEQLLLSRSIENIQAGLIGNVNDSVGAVQLIKTALSTLESASGARNFAKRYQSLNSASQAQRLAERLEKLIE